jgi:hypothetical protein
MGLFGPSREELFETYANEVGGKYSKGGAFKSSYVEIEYKKHGIKLDTYTVQAGNVPVTYTRTSLVYEELMPFDIRIGREGFLASLSKSFGAQDIQIGDEDFDARFIIKGNDEIKVKTLLQSGALKNSLECFESFSMYNRTGGGLSGIKIPENHKVIMLENKYTPKDVHGYYEMVEVLKHVLDGLLEIGVANDSECEVII